jgi:hypothetical protein
MEKLKFTACLGSVIALQGLLRLVGMTILTMPNDNVVPWELMQERRELYAKLVVMEANLRD